MYFLYKQNTCFTYSGIYLKLYPEIYCWIYAKYNLYKSGIPVFYTLGYIQK